MLRPGNSEGLTPSIGLTNTSFPTFLVSGKSKSCRMLNEKLTISGLGALTVPDWNVAGRGPRYGRGLSKCALTAIEFPRSLC